MSKRLETILYSTGGVIILALILILANFVLGTVKQRLDFSEGRVNSLSPGTRAVLNQLEGTVRIRLYYSQGDGNLPLSIKGYGRRVEDMLREFRLASNGKVTVEKFDPQPDSDAEDSAQLDGVEGQVLNNGEKFYLGLAVSYGEKRLPIPVLAADREQLLEYDIAKAISRATAKDKAVVGIMSALPVFGSRGAPQMGIPPSEKLVFVSELERDFKVKRIDPAGDRIDDDVKVLLVMHPRGFSDKALYAIDQFVMRGGKLIAMVDPNAYFDIQPGRQQADPGTASTMEKLFKAWGIGFDATKVVLDTKYISGGGPGAMPTVLSLVGDAFNKNDVTTNRVGSALVPFAGVFSGKPADGLTQTVLLHTSAFANLIDTANSLKRGDDVLRGFNPSGTEYPLAIKLTGKFKTAFPDGKPADEPKDAKDGKAAPKAAAKADAAKQDASKAAPAQAAADQRKESAENAVVLIGDTDFINDGAAVQIQQVFGQRIVVPANGNLAFALGLVEQFAGDEKLISLRSRATAARPFTVIREMEARAQQAYLGKIKALEDSLQQTSEKLQALQRQRGAGASATILTAAQQAEVDNFRRTAAEKRRELKEVRKELRADSESLEFWTKVVNIGAVPLIVTLAGVFLAISRRRRTVKL
jgi:ABC-type uncharacterized transport system involved in gliding motility auxiliary subunit